MCPTKSTFNPAASDPLRRAAASFNTTQEFSRFVQLASRDREKAGPVVVVDGAQGGVDAKDWSEPEGRLRREKRNPWATLISRLEEKGLTPAQVQAVWIKQARRNPASIGEFPAPARDLQRHLERIVRRLKSEFPNLRLAYLSSRTYAGYSETALNPEPFAYEDGFAVRWLIQDQIDGRPELNPGPDNAVAPVLLWGPYLWADGTRGRKSDDLVYVRDDFVRDGTHPSDSGRDKVAGQLMKFFKTESTAKIWFRGD